MGSKKIFGQKIFGIEIFDPLGLWEPFKVQLKLDSKALHGQEWDKKVSAELQEIWLKRFQEFLELLELVTPRCVVPDGAIMPNTIRVICLSDAGEEAGGCAIYASYLLSNKKYCYVHISVCVFYLFLL